MLLNQFESQMYSNMQLATVNVAQIPPGFTPPDMCGCELSPELTNLAHIMKFNFDQRFNKLEKDMNKMETDLKNEINTLKKRGVIEMLIAPGS